MTKFFLLSLLMMFCCQEKAKTNQKTTPLAHSLVGGKLDENSDTLRIDLNRSTIKWKGTKLMGLGKHEGDIRIQEGFLLKEMGVLSGGKFIIAMKSLRVTDIPASDPIPLRKLTEHLKSEDFFAVESYPVAIIELIKLTKVDADFLIISGILEIKGIRKPIEFAVESKNNFYKTNFKIDRFDWKIAYEGSWADRTLVDREIEFWVELAMR